VGEDRAGGYERRFPGLHAALFLAALAVLLLALVPPLPGWEADPGWESRPPAPPASLLGQCWQWLGRNKDEIGALAQLAGAAGVVVAALAFVRTQRLNRATWLFQIQKEAEERAAALLREGWTERNTARVIGFYSSIFPFHDLGLMDRQAWYPFEQDLKQILHARRAWFAAWLGASGEAPPRDFPPASNFDPRFRAYLASLLGRDQG
jgi:hypothetical protein